MKLQGDAAFAALFQYLDDTNHIHTPAGIIYASAIYEWAKARGLSDLLECPKDAASPPKGAETRDFISMHEFHYATAQGLRNVSEDYDLWSPLDEQHLPETWAALWFVLRLVPDEKHYFPCGKWSVLQRIEGMLDEWAQGRLREHDESR